MSCPVAKLSVLGVLNEIRDLKTQLEGSFDRRTLAEWFGWIQQNLPRALEGTDQDTRLHMLGNLCERAAPEAIRTAVQDIEDHLSLMTWDDFFGQLVARAQASQGVFKWDNEAELLLNDRPRLVGAPAFRFRAPSRQVLAVPAEDVVMRDVEADSKPLLRLDAEQRWTELVRLMNDSMAVLFEGSEAKALLQWLLIDGGANWNATGAAFMQGKLYALVDMEQPPMIPPSVKVELTTEQTFEGIRQALHAFGVLPSTADKYVAKLEEEYQQVLDSQEGAEVAAEAEEQVALETPSPSSFTVTAAVRHCYEDDATEQGPLVVHATFQPPDNYSSVRKWLEGADCVGDIRAQLRDLRYHGVSIQSDFVFHVGHHYELEALFVATRDPLESLQQTDYERVPQTVHPKQQAVADMILQQIEACTRGRTFSRYEFVVLVPRFNSLANQTTDRIEQLVVRAALTLGSGRTVEYHVVKHEVAERAPAFRQFCDAVVDPGNEDVLYVLVADECHWGLQRDGMQDSLLHYHDLRKQSNVVTLMVSATPYAVLTKSSRIPEIYSEPDSLLLKTLQTFDSTCEQKSVELHVRKRGVDRTVECDLYPTGWRHGASCVQLNTVLPLNRFNKQDTRVVSWFDALSDARCVCLEPRSLSRAGGNRLRIGLNLPAATTTTADLITVSVGGAACTNIRVVGTTTTWIECETPMLPDQVAGSASVVVSLPSVNDIVLPVTVDAPDASQYYGLDYFLSTVHEGEQAKKLIRSDLAFDAFVRAYRAKHNSDKNLPELLLCEYVFGMLLIGARQDGVDIARGVRALFHLGDSTADTRMLKALRFLRDRFLVAAGRSDDCVFNMSPTEPPKPEELAIIAGPLLFQRTETQQILEEMRTHRSMYIVRGVADEQKKATVDMTVRFIAPLRAARDALGWHRSSLSSAISVVERRAITSRNVLTALGVSTMSFLCAQRRIARASVMSSRWDPLTSVVTRHANTRILQSARITICAFPACWCWCKRPNGRHIPTYTAWTGQPHSNQYLLHVEHDLPGAWTNVSLRGRERLGALAVLSGDARNDAILHAA
eukprot:TRINITY_DN493_c0_g1_i12.p1 TRINITY_DN493_c0_g1~~TRINITY_DN493_c0_g1_i12.p1  ORF type:complete len:1061 (-),score=158.94 TRINITY_DN493_c0_g1_i12:3446-6628(-)